MTEEINYNIGDVVITSKGKGEVIFKDKHSSKSPMQGKWIYMLEKKEGEWIGPFDHHELELVNE